MQTISLPHEGREAVSKKPSAQVQQIQVQRRMKITKTRKEQEQQQNSAIIKKIK